MAQYACAASPEHGSVPGWLSEWASVSRRVLRQSDEVSEENPVGPTVGVPRSSGASAF